MPLRMPGSVRARLSVWLSRRERGAERWEVGVEDLEPAAIELAQGVRAAHQMDGRAALGARLGQGQGARGEVEGGEPDLPRQPRARALPVQAAGDHQVQHQEEIAVERDDDALAEARDPDHVAPTGVGERRVDGAEHERAGQAHALEPGPADARVERFDVDGDVGQLRHWLALLS